MQLTSELFRRIVRSNEPQTDQRAPHERRRAPRTQGELHATLMPFTDHFAAENLDVPIRDLSRGGFGFFHDRSVPLGEQFALLLPESSGRPLVILCTVAYWQPLDNDFFAIGARFCRVLRERQADLPLLLEDAVSGELTDSRVAS